jgi:quinohemoprotein amine dehydrogenase
LLLLAYLSAATASAQDASATATATETEPGIPVTDPLVLQKCGGCHVADAKGNMQRISWVRTTPEGWEQAIKRMVRQNNLQITPQEARAVIQYLAARHGLAPEEAKPVMYIPEHRILDEMNIPNDAVRGACTYCHAFGQPLSWRRSKNEWSLLQALHVALYAQADVAYRRPVPAAPGEAAGPQGKPLTQGQVALDYMVKTAPLHTPEWAAWLSREQTPRLEGRWAVTASAVGQGKFVGEMVIEPGAAADEFKTSLTLRSLKSGSAIKRSGAGILYAGYSWRGRSMGDAPDGMRPDNLSSEAREVLWFSPDQATAEGRWFWGAYQEFGFDVKLTRISAAPMVAAVEPAAVKAGTTGAQLRIIGENFPASMAASDLQLGTDVKVNRIVSQSATELVVDVDISPDATSGLRDAQIGGAALEKAFAVYHRIDYLKVIPEATIARLGSTTHPKGYQQFEAVGFEEAQEGKPNAAEDLRIGPVDAAWRMDEFMTSYNDDDTKFVGTLNQAALFTPASDGPNPARRFGRNNYGEVWVTATAKSEKDRFGRSLAGRSYLVVAVPEYLRWDQPEVSQADVSPPEVPQPGSSLPRGAQ